MNQVEEDLWEVPYLPIDPADVGGHYRETVRVNSQSRKGGVAFVLENHFELSLPRTLLVEFARVVQGVTDERGGGCGRRTFVGSLIAPTWKWRALSARSLHPRAKHLG